MEPLTPFTIEASDLGPCRRLMARGELDLSTAPVLQERIFSALADRREVEVDLRAVPFVDSSGLRALLLAAREADELGVGLVLLEPLPMQLRRLLEVSGVTGRLPTRPVGASSPEDPSTEGLAASDA